MLQRTIGATPATAITLHLLSQLETALVTDVTNKYGASSSYGNIFSLVNMDTSWHHLVIVYNYTPNLGTLYVDNVFQNSSTVQIPHLNSSSVIIGQHNNGNYKYNGKLDDVRIYNRPLSTQEVAQLFSPVPFAPILVSPSNGSSNVTLTPTLFWNTSTNSTNYRVQVSPSNTFSYIVDSATLSTNQRTIPSGKLNPATTYYWRVQGVNSFGNGPWSTAWSFFTVITGISQLGTEIPKEFKLYENYPNPFNPTTKIKFDLQKASQTAITIYDITGKEVETLINENLSAGKYELQWDGINKSSGVYFYRINTNEFTDIKRMILIK